MKIGDLVRCSWTEKVGIVADTHKRLYIDSVWVIWSDGSEPCWVDDDEVVCTGERSRAERDAESRKNAINIDL